MMAVWLAILVLTSLLTASSATYGYGYGYGYGHAQPPPGDYDPRVGPDMSIVAYFETGGVKGNICFYQPEPGAPVEITVKLTGLYQYTPHSFDWGISDYPVQFGHYPDFPCDDAMLGGIYDPTPCPDGSPVTCVYGNLGERLGPISSTVSTQTFTDNVLDLYGPFSPIGHGLVLRRRSSTNLPFTCANIEYQGIKLQTLRAEFSGDLNGDVILRRQEGRSGVTLNVDLFSTCTDDNPGPGPFQWALRKGTCDDIGVVCGNDTHPDEIHHGAFDDCSRENPRGCPAGDLTTKCGPISGVETAPGSGEYRYRAFCNDDQLGLIPITSIEDTILVLTDVSNATFPFHIACAPWHPINQHCARVNCIKRPRINMDILFFQNDPGDRTHIRSYITGLDMQMAYLQVRENPVTDRKDCSEAGGLYDKPRGAGEPIVGTPIQNKPTGDALPVGTVQYKISTLTNQTSLRRQDTTSWLPLFGPFSIVGRSVALVNNAGQDVLCCNIEPVADPSPAVINSILGYQEQTNVG